MSKKYVVISPDSNSLSYRVYVLDIIAGTDACVGNCVGSFDTDEYAQAYASDMQMVHDWESANIQLEVGCEFD
jgi:hypothetical protein